MRESAPTPPCPGEGWAAGLHGRWTLPRKGAWRKSKGLLAIRAQGGVWAPLQGLLTLCGRVCVCVCVCARGGSVTGLSLGSNPPLTLPVCVCVCVCVVLGKSLNLSEPQVS